MTRPDATGVPGAVMRKLGAPRSPKDSAYVYISGASSGGCCSLGLRYGARGAGDEPFLLVSHRVGEPQGAGAARLPGVYFQRGLSFLQWPATTFVRGGGGGLWREEVAALRARCGAVIESEGPQPLLTPSAASPNPQPVGRPCGLTASVALRSRSCAHGRAYRARRVNQALIDPLALSAI